MTQAELERAICRATGESRDVIRRLGFSLQVPTPPRNPSRKRAPQPGRVRKVLFVGAQ